MKPWIARVSLSVETGPWSGRPTSWRCFFLGSPAVRSLTAGPCRTGGRASRVATVGRQAAAYAGRVGGRLALVLALSGCYGGLAVGPDRGSPEGGEEDSGKGIQGFAGFQIDLPADGRLGAGAAIGQTSIGEDPEGHTPKTTWVAFELRYTQRIPPDIPVAPVLGAGGLLGDSTDGGIAGVRALVGVETRSVPVTFGAGVMPQVVRFAYGGHDEPDAASTVRSLHVALWLARSPRSDRAQPGSTVRTAQ